MQDIKIDLQVNNRDQEFQNVIAKIKENSTECKVIELLSSLTCEEFKVFCDALKPNTCIRTLEFSVKLDSVQAKDLFELLSSHNAISRLKFSYHGLERDSMLQFTASLTPKYSCIELDSISETLAKDVRPRLPKCYELLYLPHNANCYRVFSHYKSSIFHEVLTPKVQNGCALFLVASSIVLGVMSSMYLAGVVFSCATLVLNGLNQLAEEQEFKCLIAPVKS